MSFFSKISFANSFVVIVIIIVISYSYSSCSSKDEAEKHSKHHIVKLSESAVELKENMRKLWTDHVLWTRNVIFCLVDDLPGTDQEVKRLLQNEDDLGNIFKPYYGEEEGKRFTELLYPHITIAAEVIKAAKAGNTIAFEEANKKWHLNSDEIAEFLNKANPKWKLTEMKTMMSYHLQLTIDEAEQRIKKHYDADVRAFDKIDNEILKMADMLADGIIQQFPEKFETCHTNSNK